MKLNKILLTSLGWALVIWTISLYLPKEAKAACTLPTTSTTLNVRNYGAIPNDGIDDTLAIQSAIDKVSKNGTVYIPPGIYQIDAIKSINLRSNMKLVMSPKAILKTMPNTKANSAIIYGYKVDNVAIVGGILEGDRDTHVNAEPATSSWGFGLLLSGSSKVTITNTKSIDQFGDGFYVGVLQNKNITFCNVTANNNRRVGLSLTNANNVRITNSRFTNSNGAAPQTGIIIEPNRNMGVTHVWIDRNRISGNKSLGIAIYYQGKLSSSRYITDINITNNIISNHLGRGGLHIDSYSPYIIKGNTISDNLIGISILRSKGSKVLHNTITNNWIGIALYPSEKSTTITSNSLRANTYPIIHY
jgi:parallel beta-helix repeat protein